MRAQLDLCYKVIAVNNNNINAQMQVISGGNGLNLSKFNDFPTLLNAAESYFYLGYSVIPLLGDFDPSRPKVAARSWSVYQQRLANLDEFQTWFSPQGGAAALGIVTGRISRLIVLDFDSQELFTEFRRRFPDLLETRTVQSAGRGLPHLYFHLPPHLHLASQKCLGVDLLSDGRYVVAPPSTINDSAYRVTRGGMPRHLTPHDIQRIQSFITTTQSRPSIYKEESSLSLPNPVSVGTRHVVSAPLSTSSVGAEFIPPATNLNPISSVGKGLRPFRPAPLTNVSLSSPASLPSAHPPLSTQWRGAGGEDAPASTETPYPSNTISSVGKGLRPFRPVSSAPVSSSPRPEGEGLGVRVALPSRAALHGLYYYWRTKGGRNDALFRTAIYARDHGMNETQTRHHLVSLHVSSPRLDANAGGLGVRVSESPALRQREAYATIRSAFSHPPRLVSTPSPACGLSAGELTTVADEGLGRGLIPNSVREALMQCKLTCVVRTIEGLYQAGFRPDRGFTTDQALQALKGIVGRDSVYKALNALAPNGQPIFPQRSPSALPQASKEAARHKQTLKTKKCFFVTEKKSGIKKRGKKQRVFKLPTIDHLCKILGVNPSGSDPLTRDDLTTAHKTRMALQRELIKRRPAEYSRGWLAQRLGVSRRTISTYNRIIPIHSYPTYHETVLTWGNINSLLTDEIIAGSHIETILGKKYPALHAIACRLLAKGTYIRLKQRKGNFYWYGSDNPPPNTLPISSLESVGTRHAVSAPNPLPLPVPLSTQWRGVGGEDVPSPAPSLVYGLSAGELANVADEGSGWRLPAPIPPAAYPTAPVMNNSSVPSPSVGKGLRPFRSASPAPSLVYGGGLGWGLPAASNLDPNASVGEGLRPFRSASPAPLSSAQPPLSTQWRGAGGEDALSSPEQQETLAQTIYTRVNQSNDGTTKHLSLKNARKLVRTHTEKDIQFALQRLAQRTNLANPSGFFVTVLRSNARINKF